MSNNTDETETPLVGASDEITKRANELMLKLLDGIERDITAGAGALPGPHLAAPRCAVATRIE